MNYGMNSAALSEEDARAMVRLVGETAAVAATSSYQECRKFLLDGLCKMIAADAWAWTLSRLDPETHQIYYLTNQVGGMEDGQWLALAAAAEHPSMKDASKGFGEALAMAKQAVTMSREEIDPNGFSRRGELKEVWDRTGFDGMLMSGHPLDEESSSHIIVYRKMGSGSFTTRQTQMAHIVLSEVTWLHAQGWPEDRGASIPKLSPRQRSVLIMLTGGHTRKDMAAALNISENTVSGYVKEVYRHFNVHSQTELVRRFSGVSL